MDTGIQSNTTLGYVYANSYTPYEWSTDVYLTNNFRKYTLLGTWRIPISHNIDIRAVG